ncbi:MAG: hypothetical protein SFY66_08650 [Oculatellaceae cyanobacterium bins.114]|nr:hypothetical protein [Oculatellaceae cyanobacterium bins.114]
MTSHKAQIQALINEIDEVLSKPSPRLPWVMAGDADQQRQVLEQTRSYLLSLQEEIPDPGSVGLPNSPLAYNLAYPQGQAPAVESAQQVLQAVLQEMSYLRANVMQPLRQDVEQLQQQREALLLEVRMLEGQRQQQALPQAQVNQQQIITEFLQSLMGRLQENLTGQVAQMVANLEAQSTQERALPGNMPLDTVHPETGISYQPVLTAQQRLEQIQTLQSQSDQLLLKLDSTLRVIFESLQSNIQSYQDSLSQGLDKMHNLGQQGEAMFAALVNRLAQQLGREASTYLQSSLQTDWEAAGRPLPATVKTPEGAQIPQGSPFVLDLAPIADSDEDVSDDQIDLLLNELQADEPATSIQLPITSIQPPAQSPSELNFDDLDLDDLGLQLPTMQSGSSGVTDADPLNQGFPAFQVDDDITFFQVDQPLTSFQVSDDEMAQLQADLDAAVQIPEDERFVESEFEERDSALDLLNQLSAELQPDETEAQPEIGVVDVESAATMPSSQEGYDDDMSELYESLFGAAAVHSADGLDPTTEPVDQHVADATQEPSEAAISALEPSELEPFETMAALEPPLQVEVSSDAPSPEVTDALVEELFDGLVDPAQTETIALADNLASEPSNSLEDLLGEPLLLESELAVGDSVSGWQDEASLEGDIPSDVDMITSLSDLTTEPRLESASDVTDEFSADASGSQLDEDIFVPAAPDEVLLVSEDELTPEVRADLDLGDTILSQLTTDLSNLEDQRGDVSFEPDLLESDLLGSDLLEPDLLEPDLLEPDLSALDEVDIDLEQDLSAIAPDIDSIPQDASSSDEPQLPPYNTYFSDELQPPIDLFDEAASGDLSLSQNQFEPSLVDADPPSDSAPSNSWQSLLDDLATTSDPVVSSETTPEELWAVLENSSPETPNSLDLSTELQELSLDDQNTLDPPLEPLSDTALLNMFLQEPTSEVANSELISTEPDNPLIQETAFLDNLFSEQPSEATVEDSTREVMPSSFPDGVIAASEQQVDADIAASSETSSNQASLNSLPSELLDELFPPDPASTPTEPLQPDLQPTPLTPLTPASAALLATDTALPSVSIPLEDDATLDDIFATVPPLPTDLDDALSPLASTSDETPFLDDLFGSAPPIDIAAVDLPTRPSSGSTTPAPTPATETHDPVETLSIASLPVRETSSKEIETNAFTLEGLAESLFEDAPDLNSMDLGEPTFQPESEDWTLEGAFGDLGQAPPLPPEFGEPEIPSLDPISAVEDAEKKKTLDPETNFEAVLQTNFETVTDPTDVVEVGGDVSASNQSLPEGHSESTELLLDELSLHHELDQLSVETNTAERDEVEETNELDELDELNESDLFSIASSEADLPTANLAAESNDLGIDPADRSLEFLDLSLPETNAAELPAPIPQPDPAVAGDPSIASEQAVDVSLPELSELALEDLELEDLELGELEPESLESSQSPTTSDFRTAELQTSDLLELSEDLGIDAQELQALLETDFAAEEFSPPPPYPRFDAAPKVWYLGIDFGTTGISAVLLNRVSLELYPLYWCMGTQPDSPVDESASHRNLGDKQFRLPTIVYLSPSDRPSNMPDFAMDFMGQSNLVTVTFPTAHPQGASHPSVMADPSKRLLRDAKPYLNVGIPHYSPETAQWEPVLQWSNQSLSLSAVHQAVRTLLSTLSITEEDIADATTPTCAVLGMEESSFQTALRQLAGVVVGCPVGWADTFSFNIREAILGARLVNRPDQIFVVEDAIATLLSGLPSADARPLTLPQGIAQNPDLHNMDWDGPTLVINAGATVTDMALVNLPQDLQTLTYQDFHLRSLAYAGNALDQDIICHLIYPAWLQRLPQGGNSSASRQSTPPTDGTSLNYTFGSGNGAKSGTFVDGWNWQPSDAEPPSEQNWRNLGLDNLSFPLVGEPDVQNRFALQQRLSNSPIGQGLLEAARHLKLVLQQQDRFVLQLGDQQLAIARQDLASGVFLPYIQRLNRELNALMNQTGIAALNINQVMCTGGTASLAAIARWLPQKFPNATIIQDTYGGDRTSSPFSNCLPICSRVAYGLATLPLHTNVLDLARQQYSPYFLLLELLRAFPDQPLSVGAVMQLLERRGINTQVCHQQILSLLEGQLPPGLVPTEKYAYLLTPESAQNPDYRLLLSAPLFSKQGSQTYRLNYEQWNHFRRYLGTLMTSTYQKLAEPLALSLSL